MNKNTALVTIAATILILIIAYQNVVIKSQKQSMDSIVESYETRLEVRNDLFGKTVAAMSNDNQVFEASVSNEIADMAKVEDVD